MTRAALAVAKHRTRRRRRPRVVLLDIDGTLVKSNEAHARSWWQAMRDHGIEVPLAKVRAAIGTGGDKLLPTVAGVDDESPTGKAIAKRRGKIFKKKYLRKLRPTKGARELVERLWRDGYVLVVVSSAAEKEIQPLLEVAKVDKLLRERVSSADVDRSKPDPDAVHAALRKAGAKPAEAVLLGDTPYDIRAALSARVATIALRSGGWDDDALAGAIAIYDDPADLLRHYEKSVFA